MEKLGFISNIDTWLRMRDVHNRIAQEYLPGELVQIYYVIVGMCTLELRRLRDKLS